MPRKPAKQSRDKSVASHEAHRKRETLRQRTISKTARDIGKLPAIVNPQRRERCRITFECFCREYLPEIFDKPWSPDHRKAITKIEASAIRGGLFAFAMPRGSGKTALVIAACLWAILYGYRKYMVIVGSDAEAAEKLINILKRQFEKNELLHQDFPEACYPVKHLERAAQRAHGQTYKGKFTLIKWTANEIVLPTIEGSACSGSAIEVGGITGGIRGKIGSSDTGGIKRPDLVILDDPQTDESAKSPSQVADRAKIIRKTILGLAGPGKKMSVFMPCTVIESGDLSEEFLDRQKNPQWQGERTKTLYGWPTNEERWEEYQKIRIDEIRAGDENFPLACDFYVANREAMDAGCNAAWLSRKYDNEVSAVQHAMDLYFDLGKEAFLAEYQNEPVKPESESAGALTSDQICAKANGKERGIVPMGATHLVSFIDIQKEVLFYGVLALEDAFTGHVVEYGVYPDQRRMYFAKSDIRRKLMESEGATRFEQSIRSGLDSLAAKLLGRDWKREDGGIQKIGSCLVDAHDGDVTDIVRKFARESTYSAILIPSFGIGVGPGNLPFDQKKPQPGEIRRNNWSRPKPKPGEVRHVSYDTNFYKSFLQERFRQEPGGEGCFTIFGAAEDHRMFADHLTSEYGVPTTGRERAVTVWIRRPNRDNDWLDVMTGCCVAGSILGASLKELKPRESQPVKKRKLSEFMKG